MSNLRFKFQLEALGEDIDIFAVSKRPLYLQFQE